MTLRRLLDAGARFDAGYGGALANHLPMALVALEALGAPDARLEAFANSYSVRLRPAPAPVEWPVGDAWPSHLGQAESWPLYRSLFAQWLSNEPPAAVLPRVLPTLMEGCGAAAFHGLIRTASAVSVGHDGELADGLAYWASCHLPLEPGEPVGADEAGIDDPTQALHALRHALGGWRATQNLIVDRMQAAAAQPAFAAQVCRLRLGTDAAGALAALARLAARCYGGGRNFTVLHLVTGCHALRVLLPYLADPQMALRQFWVAYAAGAAGVPDAALATAPLADASPDWSRIVARAVVSDDEHVIKLVYSAREEQLHHGGADDWARAAARAVTPD